MAETQETVAEMAETQETQETQETAETAEEAALRGAQARARITRARRSACVTISTQ
jgi:hypothetical protein